MADREGVAEGVAFLHALEATGAVALLGLVGHARALSCVEAEVHASIASRSGRSAGSGVAGRSAATARAARAAIGERAGIRSALVVLPRIVAVVLVVRGLHDRSPVHAVADAAVRDHLLAVVVARAFVAQGQLGAGSARRLQCVEVAAGNHEGDRKQRREQVREHLLHPFLHRTNLLVRSQNVELSTPVKE